MLPACKLPEPPLGGSPAIPEAGPKAAKKLRVLLVSHCLVEEPRAGTESYVANLGRALAEIGIDVMFLAPEGPPSRGPQEAIPWRETRLGEQPLLQFTRINQDFGTLLRHPGFEVAFRNILQQHRMDLIHFHHTYLSSISLLEVSLNLGLPVVLTLHDAWHLCPRLHCVNDQGLCGGPEDLERCTTCLEPWLEERLPETRQKLLQFLTKRRMVVQTLLSRCRLVAPSRFLRNLHYRCGVAPGGIIHLPLGLDDLGPVPQIALDNPSRFVFLGNIIPVKRLDLAVAAFAPLAGQAVLEIWGGLPRVQQKPLRKSLAPYPHIRYRGPYSRADLPRILAGAAATVIPSDFENCPLVARESLMLRVPVIASRAGGLPEIIHHHQNGLLFPPGDVEALRLHVTRLLRHPDLRARLRRGIAPVKSLPTEARELVGLYRSMTPSLNGVRTAS
jgi:glycosyltransferase involved in cell wall biosynthesis